MISFFICLLALISSYFIYGRFLERIVGVDETHVTPAYRMENGVDYVPMNKYRNLLIHFLNNTSFHYIHTHSLLNMDVQNIYHPHFYL